MQRRLTRAFLGMALFAAAAGCSSERGTVRAESSLPVSAPTPPAGGRPWDGLAYPVWEPDAYGGTEVFDGLADIAALGAGAVSLIPTWYVENTTTSLPSRDPEQTPSDSSLLAAIDEAHRLGLRVVLKPHIDLVDDGDRAEITPTDPGAWFARYRELMVAYATMAQRAGVEMLSVGTELAGTMDQRALWTSTINAIKAVYDGPLTYAANFDGYADVPFWGQLDVIGIDAYFELVDEPTTDVGQLVTAWEPVLDRLGKFAGEHDRPMLFTEAGYVSQVGTTVEPWNWEIGTDRSDEEQVAGYQALLEATADRPWLKGVQWWMWDDLTDAGEDQSLDYTPHGKPAEAVLRDVWSDA